ncbi:swi/snf and rsc complexes subunit ssr4 [Acrodontium crateriforme]|uniref:Swi/snf and rsc complexes subunit ssr4 n=1 Tax=Acrodontium crateriforme TaxID=150365 RepID=A0AAQ3M3C2_9PEZI|nr:swi/snf and rsc complexes subunit ssr4 [Acrodontium crateriforme]
MQDPSQGVAQPLQNHVHLISGYNYPRVAALNLEQAFRHLIDAPQIVKQVAPMAWTYVSAPLDGTIWLEWLPPNLPHNRFPSDGYVWADAEQTYRQEIGGYTVEIMQHAIGYRYQYDQMATHARTRYHLIQKNPSVNAASPDPLLWIVHYHQAEPQRVLPAQQIPPNPQMFQILNERKWLESQGRLEKKDFMLHDSGHWPQINVPSGGQMRQGQPPSFPMALGHHGRQSVSQQGGGYPQAPPPKKPRVLPPAAPNDGGLDTSIEDEENTTLGDYFDHLTPRDISVARYTQHHRWMEEVFSSPYASSQIIPADLGLGLMGELRGLTEGILEPPSLDSLNGPQVKPQKATEAQPFTNLKKEQLEEFNKRVEKHLEDGQAEIQRMKAEHAAKMQEWKKTKILTQAEKRLRNATWSGHENAVPAYRLEEVIRNANAGAKENVEDVIKDVEFQLGIKISSHKEADMAQRGGLEDEPERSQGNAMDEDFDQQAATHSGVTNATKVGLNQQDSATASQKNLGRQSSLGRHVQPPSQQPSSAVLSGTQNVGDGSATDLTNIDLNDDTMMGDVDLDMDTGVLDFDASGLDGINETGVSMGETSSQTLGAQITSETAARAPTALGDAKSQAEAGHNQRSAPLSENANSNMFDDTTFDDLGGADDGLIDFEGGMGMDDSAFGDALHGMEDDEGAGNGAV